jgi:hypothetical protein
MIEIPKGFWYKLSRNHTEWTTHLVIADWCEDHDDLEQAKIWRWLVRRKKVPYRGDDYWVWDDSIRSYYSKNNVRCCHGLPWTVMGKIYSKDFRTHRKAMEWAILRLYEAKWV